MQGILTHDFNKIKNCKKIRPKKVTEFPIIM